MTPRNHRAIAENGSYTPPHGSGSALAAGQDRPGAGLSWTRLLLAFLLVCVAAFEAYGPALNGEFLFDDSYLPFLVPGVAEAPLTSWLGVRPLLMFSYWLNFHISGLNPFPYHAFNVLLHALNACLIALIVRRFLEWAGERGWVRDTLSIFAGALFLLHPVQTESVAYVAGRSETMSIFFFLAALALFVYRREPAISLGRAIAVVAVFGMACTVKEHTVVLPALLLLTDYYFNPGFRLEGIRRNARLYLPIFVAGGLGALAVVNLLRNSPTAGFSVKEFTWQQYLFTQFRVIWLYVRLYIAPFAQNGDYDWSVSQTLFDPGSLLGLLAILVAAAAAWRYRREYPLASYGFFGFLILLAPTSSVVPIKDVAVERRLYLPFLCLLLITVDFLRRWRTTRGTMSGVLAGVCVLAGILTYQRSQVYSGNLAFWQDVVQKSPRNARARFQLAYAQWQGNDCQSAVRTYAETAALQKLDDRLLIDWALALDCAQKPDEAVEKLRKAAELGPPAHPYALIGMIYGKRGQAAPALDALVKAEQADPSFEMTYVYRGNVYASQGNYSEAIANYRRALALNANSQPAREGLAMAESQQRR